MNYYQMKRDVDLRRQQYEQEVANRHSSDNSSPQTVPPNSRWLVIRWRHPLWRTSVGKPTLKVQS